MPYFNQLSTLA